MYTFWENIVTFFSERVRGCPGYQNLHRTRAHIFHITRPRNSFWSRSSGPKRGPRKKSYSRLFHSEDLDVQIFRYVVRMGIQHVVGHMKIIPTTQRTCLVSHMIVLYQLLTIGVCHPGLQCLSNHPKFVKQRHRSPPESI